MLLLLLSSAALPALQSVLFFQAQRSASCLGSLAFPSLWLPGPAPPRRKQLTCCRQSAPMQEAFVGVDLVCSLGIGWSDCVLGLLFWLVLVTVACTSPGSPDLARFALSVLG